MNVFVISKLALKDLYCFRFFQKSKLFKEKIFKDEKIKIKMEKNKVKEVMILKYKIATTLLPIDIDLQRIAELYSKDKENAEKYFNEAFSNRKANDTYIKFLNYLKQFEKLLPYINSTSKQKRIEKELIEIKDKIHKVCEVIDKGYQNLENEGIENIKNQFHSSFIGLDELLNKLIE